MRKTCVTIAILCMTATGCGDLDPAALDALLDGLITGDSSTQIDDLDNTNSNTSDNDATDIDSDIDSDDATSDDDANDNTTNGDGNTNANDNDNDNATDDGDELLPRVDFSGFLQFVFSRSPGLGFCPPLDELFSASIFVNADGTHTLSLSVLRAGVAGLDVCEDTFVVPCATATQLEQRILTDDEAAAVIAAFSAVRVDDEPDPICQTVAIDPCVINTFAWDSFAFTDYECGTERLRPNQANAIINLLEQMRSGRN